MSEDIRGRLAPWQMTGPQLIEELASGACSAATMKSAQAKEVQALIAAWTDAAASDHAHAQQQAERAERAEADRDALQRERDAIETTCRARIIGHVIVATVPQLVEMLSEQAGEMQRQRDEQCDAAITARLERDEAFRRADAVMWERLQAAERQLTEAQGARDDWAFRCGDADGRVDTLTVEVAKLRKALALVEDWLAEPVPDAPKNQGFRNDERMAWRAGYFEAVNEVAQCVRDVEAAPIERAEVDPYQVLEKLVAGALTQQAAAEHLGLSPQYLTDLMHRRRRVSDKVLTRLGLKRIVVARAALAPQQERTAGERPSVRVAMMSCGCEYLLDANARPPAHCISHGHCTVTAVRYDQRAALAPTKEEDRG